MLTSRIIVGIAGLVIAASCGGAGIVDNSDPVRAEVVTSDIDNFWRAYDAGGKDGSESAFQREYLDRASTGLRAFASSRAVTASSLAQLVRRYPRYFAALRAPMVALSQSASTRSSIRAAYARLEELYPDAVFPTVTLLVGRFSTAGTTGGNGILIGAEFYPDAATPRDELGPFERRNVHGPDSLPFVVAHESIHIQQMTAGTLRGASSTLLEQALSEGIADFLGELASGGNINGWLHPWAIAREAELWASFKTEMHGRDVSRWLYNQGSATADRPGDLGYFIGYRIAKSYYDRQPDKRAAVRMLITTRDAAALLGASGYEPRS